MPGEITMSEDGARAMQEAENLCWRANVAILSAEHLLAPVTIATLLAMSMIRLSCRRAARCGVDGRRIDMFGMRLCRHGYVEASLCQASAEQRSRIRSANQPR